MEDLVQKVKFQRDLQEWVRKFESLVSQLARNGQQLDENAITLLRLHSRTVSVWLSVCTSAEECAVDLHIADFEEIIELGAKLVSQGEPGPSRPEIFSFEMGLIAPLYYAALKCRVPSLRRRALQVLRLAPRREGLWKRSCSCQDSGTSHRTRREDLFEWRLAAGKCPHPSPKPSARSNHAGPTHARSS